MSIAELIEQTVIDPLRKTTPFADNLLQAQDEILQSKGVNAEAALNEWLSKHQPCLFGKIAARLNLLSYCIIDAQTIQSGDEAIHEVIQDARCGWLRGGFKGEKHGFVILLASQRLAIARPDTTVQQIAKTLLQLYLELDDTPLLDTVYLDQIFLELPNYRDTTRVWDAGINYFASHGDGRWWCDHRIPGGIGLSINSVGHMVASMRITQLLREDPEAVGLTKQDLQHGKSPATLAEALLLAMKTIGNAQQTPDGTATQLVPKKGNSGRDLPGEYALPAALGEYRPDLYTGYYHTDHTLPSAYFSQAVSRPIGNEPLELDLTYLWDAKMTNPAHRRMGIGRRIRDSLASTAQSAKKKICQFVPTLQPIEDCQILKRAIEERDEGD